MLMLVLTAVLVLAVLVVVMAVVACMACFSVLAAVGDTAVFVVTVVASALVFPDVNSLTTMMPVDDSDDADVDNDSCTRNC